MNHKYIWIAKEITSFLETYAIVMVCAPTPYFSGVLLDPDFELPQNCFLLVQT